ncbi:phospholipase D family protein [Acidovorax sp. sif1233]|uniref:phospholipase D family protein n=1 Tax=Acidovorax sp. sif1233 TaxID=2854792 RepID=UPI001C4650C5|nr:phospholipase D family protein [Acidovorax sp. sif1233]MBV7455362.1 phospholipase D family protein [Acidovorax sp. sif1233]
MSALPPAPAAPAPFLGTTARYGWLAVLAMCIASAITGCAGLPKDVDRPVSSALASPADTALGQLVETRRASAGGRHPSGFLLLSGPQAAYSSRLALVDAAQKTLDLQYYAIHADASTERLLLGVIAAAQRGVRVRVLLDDFHSTGRDAQVMRLAFVPNIEMRMFNPLTGARGSPLGRMLGALGDFSRVQQRMHNKLFIADNAMGVTGGRNLGDAYFGNADSGNFVDLDVLAAGPVVQDLSRSFDSYWNNERAYPVQSLVTQQELDTLRERTRTSDAARRDRIAGQGGTLAPDSQPVQDGSQTTTAQRARIWDYEPMDLAQAQFTWAPAAVLVDKPAKIPPDGTSTGALPEKAPARASPMAITSRGPRAATAGAVASAPVPARATDTASGPLPGPNPPSTASAAPGVPGAEALDAQTDTVVDGLLQLMGQARQDLLIISPYFVPGPDMKQAFAAARARGVRVRVLTNSLASNDAPIAHAGYARHRPDLLAMGVELYEMRSELTGVLRGALGSTGSTGGGGKAGASGAVGSSRAMLHSKLLILDGRLLAVGSMNLDIRSQRQNTEIALLIRSGDLSRRATAQIEAALREVAWHVQLNDDRLVWRAPEGSGLADATSEPDASAPLRLMLQLLGPLAPDHLL